jgi:type II secretory pathway component PulF
VSVGAVGQGPSLGSTPQVARVFQSAVRQVLEWIEAERVVILFGEGKAEPTVRAAHGIAIENFWKVAPLSLSLLREVQATGKPVERLDVQSAEQGTSLSLMITEIRSIVCTPLWSSRGNVAGMIYADWVSRPCPKKAQALARLQETGLAMERFIRQVENGETGVRDPFAPPPQGRAGTGGLPAAPWRGEGTGGLASPPKRGNGTGGLSGPGAQQRRSVETSTAPSVTRRARTFERPGGRELAFFLRALATMFGSGMPLVLSLVALSRQRPQGPMEIVAEDLARRVERGQSFSLACQEVGVFSELTVGTMLLGERSGRLHFCLERLASWEEQSMRRRYELVSALIYPAFVLAGCLLFILVAPVAMLSAQARMLEQLHVEIPMLTKVMLGAYAAVSRPQLAVPLMLSFLTALAAPTVRSPALGWLRMRLLRWQPLQRLWGDYLFCQWTQSLSIPLRSGVSMVESMKLAGQASQSLHLRSCSERAVAQLQNGEELWSALAGQQFPRLLVEMVRVGEETGRLPRMLDWLATHYEGELRWRLDELKVMLEPLVMTVLGTLVALMMLATLLPMAKALEQL